MSTHACIAVLRPDASIHSVYLHSDGYLSWAGARLQRSFNTYKKATELIGHGGMSRLADDLGTKHDMSTPRLPYIARTSFYARDRGEELQIEHHANFAIFSAYSTQWEFTYFFNGEKWLTWSHAHTTAEPLSLALIKDRLTS